jgi:Holliday junction resolvasome RuvABC endonuclease subunit
MKILGVDPSLNSTGYCYKDKDGYIAGTIEVKQTKKNSLKGLPRLQYVKNHFEKVLNYTNPELVVYEDYAMGAIGKTFSIGELGGILKLVCFERRINILLISPRVLKKFIAGTGLAEKEDIKQSIAQKYKLNIGKDDEADAFCLYQIGEEFLNGKLNLPYSYILG